MKKTLLFIISFFTLGSLIAQAQMTTNSSRLNMANKKQLTGLDRPILVHKPAVIEYKPLALQKPQALTNYYRALLFANPASLSSSTESTAVTAVNGIEKAEHRGSNFEDKSRGIEDYLFTSDRITVSNVYPNPASDYAELDYTLQSSVRDAKIVVLNVLASPVAEYVLDKSDRKLRLNTREMPTGIYFYRLVVEGKNVATKKLLVRHQQ